MLLSTNRKEHVVCLSKKCVILYVDAIYFLFARKTMVHPQTACRRSVKSLFHKLLGPCRPNGISCIAKWDQWDQCVSKSPVSQFSRQHTSLCSWLRTLWILTSRFPTVLSVQMMHIFPCPHPTARLTNSHT